MMRKFVLAAAVLAMAGMALPSVASARSGHKEHMMRHHHRHCHIVKKKVRVHHHWAWRNVKVCR
jgi:hypothetical protein